MTVQIGQDIEAICGKCGDVWHVVVAMDGEKIAKVHCKQCSGNHRYRPPADAPKSLARRSTLKSAAPKAERPKKAGTRSKKAAAAKTLVEANDRPAQRYSPKSTFEVGDTVEHPTFGTGVVQRIPAPGKMAIAFSGTERLLVHGRG